MNINQNLKSIPGILAITLILLVIIVVDVSASPPSNDNIVDATVIDYFPYSNSSNTVEASVEDTDPETCGGRLNSIWYKYTPANDAVLKISAYTDFQNIVTLAIYRDDGGLTPIECLSNQSGVSVSYDHVEVMSGVTYYFELMSRFASEIYPPPNPAPPEDGGNIYFYVTDITPPTNDNWIDATVVQQTPYSDYLDTTYATVEPDEPGPCGWTSQRTIWYAFTPGETGLYNIETTYESYEILAVYTGSDLANLQMLECTNGWVARLTPTLEAGTEYYIQVFSVNGNNITLNITFTPIPTNDNFANAKIITELPFTETVDNEHTTTELNEPTACGWYFQQTIWYAFTPSTSGSYTAEALSGTLPLVAVYTGTSFDDLQMIDCRMDWDRARTSVRMDAGKTYYFQVYNVYAWSGPGITFNLYLTPPPEAYLSYWPGDPLKNESVQFSNDSYDPGGNTFQSCAWDFGDSSTSTDCYPIHAFTADGDYTVQLTVTTTDGRSASTSNIVQVRTHDVGITKFTVPTSARAGQTKQISVSLKNLYYPESVQVDLYKVTQNGLELICTVTRDVPIRPPNRAQVFTFNYTFTNDDATIGKVTFKAIVTLINTRDVFPSDNEAISVATRVTR